jgi:multidrug efflux pump subunit AcrB
MAAILIAGITTWFKLKKEIFPETSTNVVSFGVPYPGATPEEVEKGVCIPIEEAIRDVEGVELAAVERIISTPSTSRIASSIGIHTPFSTSSGVAPG